MSKRFRIVLVIAATIAVVSFLFAPYYPRGGFWGTITGSSITLTDPCPDADTDTYGQYTITPPPKYSPPPSPPLCGMRVPYHWILSVLIIGVVGFWLWEMRKKAQAIPVSGATSRDPS
jgi:hypothetical protein